MKINKKIPIFLITLILLISIPTQVFAFTFLWDSPQTLDHEGYVGRFTYLGLVMGRPAISYYDTTNGDLKFIRANDANGTSWGTPQTLDSTGNVGKFNSMAIVNGFPAISYYDQTNGNLKFIRATNSTGTSWGAPQTLDNATRVGEYTSLAIINGVPAISYLDWNNYDLKYIKANDFEGISWGTPQTLDSVGVVGQYTSLALVNGRAAISYFDGTNGRLKFIRANNIDGTSWDSPQILDTDYHAGMFSSLAVINGSPAIAYHYWGYGDLRFIRATNANGTSWGSPQDLDTTGIVGKYTSLAVINGVPAISYFDEDNNNLKFIQARDADGASWGPPQTLADVEYTGLDPYLYDNTSLAEINGVPAISYFDSITGDLKYITTMGSVNISLWEGASQINDGETLDFGSTTLGTPITTNLTIRNNGNAAMNFDGISLPNGFSLTGTYPTEIASGASQDIHIRLDALQTGTFSGNLQISSADTNQSPISITLEGIVSETHGEIAVFDGATEIMDGTGAFDYGSTTIGTPISHTFTVENTSAEDLNLYSLSLPSGFSLQGTYNSTVPAGDSTDITVRLDAISVGTYSGQFSLGNNDADENPYNFTISGEVLDTSGEIAMFDGLTGIADGETTPIDFGTTALGTPVSRTFTIQNLGSNALDIYALTLPSGFSLQGSYNHVVAPSSSTTITVQLDASFVGSYSGDFSLSNDDADENPFNFAISGEVNSTALETDIIVPLNGSTILDSSIQVAFNHDVLHDGSTEAADNPINYLLVEDGTNGLFETTTCLAGVAGDDVQQTINSVTYNTSTFIATINTDPLPAGHYQLLACGTASIEDATGNVLNGGAFDSVTAFTVVSASGSGSGSTVATAAYLPATGFTPNKLTILPTQPADLAYNEMDSLTLQIPSLKVDVPIVGVPQTNTGWDVTWLTNAQAGWLNGTAYPTWDGNTVITGHVTNASGNPGPFANIKTLKFGDQITIQAYGEEYTYEVRENKLVTSDNLSVVEEHKDRDWVTLITCEYFNENTGQYLFRRVIRAVLVKVE